MNKKILVTGATRGIGKAIFEEMLLEGEVFAIARNENMLKELKKLGAKEVLKCDLSFEIEKAEEFINKNKINILINNAGTYDYSPLEDAKFKEIENLLKTNVEAPILLSKFVLPNMKKENWGRIVNIGSISGVMGEANASVYSASKSSLIGFSKALALEVAFNNITVNVINPGWVDTELCDKSIESSQFSYEEIIESIPQRRYIKPREVAKLVKYLISEDAKGVTGQSVNLCAGLSVGY